MTIDGNTAIMKPMKTNRLLPALLLGVLATWGCGGAEVEGASQDSVFTRVVNVQVTTIQPRTFTEVIRLTGTAEANQDVVISAEESGVLREILVEKGNRVEAGEAIFRLDSDLLQAQVDQARAMASMARETWERRKRLYEEDQVGSELVYLEAKYASEQAAANLRLLEERLARTFIRAPIDGILDSREIEVGTMVGAGTPVARIVDNDPVKVSAGVPERYAADVKVGASATASFDVLAGETFQGRISYAGAAVNPRNRTFPVEMRLPNPGGIIKPEMVASLALVRRTSEEAYVVPQEALIRVEGGYIVFVVEEDDGGFLARSRRVEVGPGQDNEIMILSGLETGDRLVVVGQASVADGDRVRVVAEG